MACNRQSRIDQPRASAMPAMHPSLQEARPFRGDSSEVHMDGNAVIFAQSTLSYQYKAPHTNPHKFTYKTRYDKCAWLADLKDLCVNCWNPCQIIWECTCGGLVHEDHFWVANERNGNRQTPLHTPTVSIRPLICGVRQLHLLTSHIHCTVPHCQACSRQWLTAQLMKVPSIEDEPFGGNRLLCCQCRTEKMGLIMVSFEAQIHLRPVILYVRRGSD